MDKATVLIVDDDRYLLASLRRALRTEGYQIVLAHSAFEALNILASVRVDVLVSDENMPGLQGQDLIRLVHDHHPETVRILLTGNATLELARTVINKAQIFRLLDKPCSAIEIGVAIRDALKHGALLRHGRNELIETQTRNAALAELEAASPGISHLNVAENGAIILEEDQ